MRKVVSDTKIISQEDTFKRKLLRAQATPAEKLFWVWLRKECSQFKWRRQHSLGYYIADFYCHELKLAIELDGHHHDHGDRFEYDKIRSEYFNSNNIRVLRFHNDDVLKNLPETLEKIRSIINQ